MGFLTGINKNTIQEFVDPSYGRKAETFQPKELKEMKAWADKELDKAKKDLADLKSGKKREMIGFEDWTPQAIRAKEKFIDLLEDFNRKYKEIQAEAKTELAEAKKEQEEKPKKKAKPWVNPDLQKPKKSEKSKVKKEEIPTPQKTKPETPKVKEAPVVTPKTETTPKDNTLVGKKTPIKEAGDQFEPLTSTDQLFVGKKPNFLGEIGGEGEALFTDNLDKDLFPYEDMLSKAAREKITAETSSVGTITSYSETPSHTIILGNGPASVPSEFIGEREGVENGSLVFNELQEKIFKEANNPRVKLLTAISSIWVDGAKKAAESQTTFWFFDGEQKAINKAISDITQKLGELNSHIFSKDRELTEEDINNYVSSIFAIMEKIEAGGDSLFEDGENIIDNLGYIKKLLEGATEENYEKRLAKLLELSAGGFRDGNTEKSKDIAKSIIINRYFADMSNNINWLHDFSSMDDNFFMSITYGINHEDSKEMVEDVKATYKEVYNETAKHREELEKNFLEQNPDFKGNLTETINRLISKAATIQSQKMAKYLFVQDAIESDQFNGNKDVIVDAFKELDSFGQDTKEFLANNGVAIAMSLIPLGAGFAAVGMLAKGASWAARGKTALDYGWKGQALINTGKGVVFYEGMNAMNTAMYGMNLEQFLEGATDGKEIVKSALFFNAMGIVSKYVKPGDKFISAQTAKSIGAELGAFTGIDLTTELAFEGEMSVEQFFNSILTGGIMTVLSRGAGKLSPSMRGRFEDSKPRRETSERGEIHGTGPYEGPASSVEFFRNKLTGTIYIKRPDGKLRYPNGKIARIKEENLQRVEASETTINTRETDRQKASSENQLSYIEEGTNPKIAENKQRYIKTLDQIKREKGEEKLNSLVKEIREDFDRTAKKIGLNVSSYGKQDTWIYWDIAKQEYFVKNPREANPNYSRESAFDNPTKIQEIIDRHLGWEIKDRNSQYASSLLGKDSEINKIIRNDGHTTSYEYSQLGKFARESKAPEGQKGERNNRSPNEEIRDFNFGAMKKLLEERFHLIGKMDNFKIGEYEFIQEAKLGSDKFKITKGGDTYYKSSKQEVIEFISGKYKSGEISNQQVISFLRSNMNRDILGRVKRLGEVKVEGGESIYVSKKGNEMLIKDANGKKIEIESLTEAQQNALLKNIFGENYGAFEKAMDMSYMRENGDLRLDGIFTKDYWTKVKETKGLKIADTLAGATLGDLYKVVLKEGINNPGMKKLWILRNIFTGKNSTNIWREGNEGWLPTANLPSGKHVLQMGALTGAEYLLSPNKDKFSTPEEFITNYFEIMWLGWAGLLIIESSDIDTAAKEYFGLVGTGVEKIGEEAKD